jgi:hypothetical protein
MEPRTSFLSLCAHSFVWWLLTNALGAALVYVRFLLLASNATYAATSGQVDLALASLIIPYLAATYLTLFWPIFALLPQWWALAAQQPQARRGRLLLVILGPIALLTASQSLWLHREPLEIMGCYVGASLVSAAWMFRRWLW